MKEYYFLEENCTPEIKKVRDIRRVLLESNKATIEKEVYLLFHNVETENESSLLKKENLRFDLAHILPGKCGCEYNRTYGHYHKNKQDARDMPELIQNLCGQMLLLIQNRLGNEVELIFMKPYDVYIVQPGYAHANLNIGNDVVKFVSLSSLDNEHDYELINLNKGTVINYTDVGIVINKNYQFTNLNIRKSKGRSIKQVFNVDKKEIYDLLKHPEILRFLNEK